MTHSFSDSQTSMTTNIFIGSSIIKYKILGFQHSSCQLLILQYILYQVPQLFQKCVQFYTSPPPPPPSPQESDEHCQQQREAEEMLRQTEEDADEEILQLKNKYEWQLRKRQEECTKMKGELGLQNKKVYTLHTVNESKQEPKAICFCYTCFILHHFCGKIHFCVAHKL